MHFSRDLRFPNKCFVQRRHANASGSGNGSNVSCNLILIIGATSGRLSGPGKKVIPTTGVNIANSTQSMHNAAGIHNGAGNLATRRT
jgi:hypothetical protein